MNKKFLARVMSYIDHLNNRIEEFYKCYGDEYSEYSEEQKIEINTLETELSTTKWLRDMYLEYSNN